MKRVVTYAILIIVSFLLQSTISTYFALGDITPNIMIILTTSIALIRGNTEGMVVGFFSGLMLDVLYSNYLGIYALIYLVLGFIFGFFNKIYYQEDITLPIILIALSDFMYGICIYVFFFLINGRFEFFYYFQKIILPETVYTVIIAIFSYRIVLRVCGKLDKKGSEDLIV